MRTTVVFGHAGRWLAWLAAAALGAGLLAVWPRATPTAGQEIREGPRREAFLSGGARAEIVLREIAETLKRIDARLERFEQALREAQQGSAQHEPAGQPAELPPLPEQPAAAPQEDLNP